MDECIFSGITSVILYGYGKLDTGKRIGKTNALSFTLTYTFEIRQPLVFSGRRQELLGTPI